MEVAKRVSPLVQINYLHYIFNDLIIQVYAFFEQLKKKEHVINTLYSFKSQKTVTYEIKLIYTLNIEHNFSEGYSPTLFVNSSLRTFLQA